MTIPKVFFIGALVLSNILFFLIGYSFPVKGSLIFDKGQYTFHHKVKIEGGRGITAYPLDMKVEKGQIVSLITAPDGSTIDYKK